MTCHECDKHNNPHTPFHYPDACHTPCTNIEVEQVHNLPIDRFGRIPDYFLTVHTEIDQTDGTVKECLMTTPGAAIFPDGNLAHVYPFETNNSSLSVEPGQVVPAYIENTGVMNTIHAADATHPAQFLITNIEGGRAYCQALSWVRIPEGHKYLIGMSYYRATEEGQVTTDPEQTGQYLFTPMDRYTLLANVSRS